MRVVCVLHRLLRQQAVALSNGAARKPPMGWLSWARFRRYSDCDNDPEKCLSVSRSAC